MIPVRVKIPFYVWPLALTIFIAVGYTIAWHKAAEQMEQFVDGWIEDQRKAGLIVKNSNQRTHGFPFFLRTSIITATIGDGKSWLWSSEKLDIDILPYDFSRVIFSPSGEQFFSIGTQAEGWQDITGTAEKIRASLGQDKERDWYFILDVEAATVSAYNGDAKATFNNFLLNVSPSTKDETIISINTQLNDFDFNMNEGHNDHKINLPLFQFSSNVTHTDKFELGLPEWSKNGGAITINHLIAENDPSQFSAEGKISIDENGYPLGTIDTRLIKPVNFMATLRNSGFLTEEQVDAATGAIAIATLSGGGAIQKQFILRDGSIIVDGQRIGELPKLAND